MSQTAFIFPGQGAQYFGMGRDFYEKCPESAAVFQLAEEACGLPVKRLCFEENEQLNITEYTQVCLLATELAVLKAVAARGFTPCVTAGLSLGEYAALVAAKKLDMTQALKLVRQRGIYMQEAVPDGGAMAAVLGLGHEAVERICAETKGLVEPANYNCPGQIVISGEVGAVAAAGEAIKAAGAKKVAMLKVSGPFHSSMLSGAGERLAKALETVVLTDSNIPYVSNTEAEYVTECKAIKPLLIRQVSSAVRWEQSIRKMIGAGVDTFVEIGPGKTLCGFLKRIDRSVTAINIDKYEDLDKLLKIDHK